MYLFSCSASDIINGNTEVAWNDLHLALHFVRSAIISWRSLADVSPPFTKSGICSFLNLRKREAHNQRSKTDLFSRISW